MHISIRGASDHNIVILQRLRSDTGLRRQRNVLLDGIQILALRGEIPVRGLIGKEGEVPMTCKIAFCTLVWSCAIIITMLLSICAIWTSVCETSCEQVLCQCWRVLHAQEEVFAWYLDIAQPPCVCFAEDVNPAAPSPWADEA